MKTLLLVRHAKSGWDDPKLSDFERTLTQSGKSDARMMAERLKGKSIKIQLFVSSPAKRARKTAKIFIEELDEKEQKLLLVPSLYEASVDNFYDVIESLEEKENEVAIFAHNPGITEFAHSLECFPIHNIPTCGVFAVKVKTEDWKNFRRAEKEFLFFDYPKRQE